MSMRARLTAAIWADRPKNYAQECARRMRQIKAGQLKGSYIDDAARYHAAGLTAPGDFRIIETVSEVAK